MKRFERVASPGPCDYSPYISKHRKGGTIQKAFRLPVFSINQSPGPGQYFIKQGIGGPQYSIRNRIKPKYNENPGPGSYSHLFHKNLKLGTIGRNRRECPIQLQCQSPGPKYSSFSKSNRTFGTIGKSLRDFNQRFITPGPGAYVIPLSLTPKAVSFKSKSKPKVLESTPGPGQYQSFSPLNRKGAPIGRSSRFFDLSHTIIKRKIPKKTKTPSQTRLRPLNRLLSKSYTTQMSKAFKTSFLNSFHSQSNLTNEEKTSD